MEVCRLARRRVHEVLGREVVGDEGRVGALEGEELLVVALLGRLALVPSRCYVAEEVAPVGQGGLDADSEP